MPDTEHEKLATRIETAAEFRNLPDIRSIIAKIPEVRQLYFAAAIRCLGARKFYYSKAVGEMVFEPDYLSQLKAVAWLSAYADGLPMQTTVNLNLSGDKGPTLEEATANSPALVAALEKALDQAKQRTRKPARVKAGEVELVQ